MLLSSCKKDAMQRDKDGQSNDSIHIVGLPIDTALIFGSWHLTGSSGIEYYDLWPYDSFPYSESYHNRYREFTKNGFLIDYKIENGIRVNLDTLIYSYKKIPTLLDEIKTYEYRSLPDSTLENSYYYFAAVNYYPYFDDSLLLLQVNNAINYEHLDTLKKVN
jgi:hypothetical protein